MAINLIDILQKQLGDSMVNQASSFLGESESKTKTAIGGILPALLGIMTKKADSNAGANALFNAVKDGGFDGRKLNNIASLFSGGNATNDLMKSGSGILDMLMGNKVGGIVDSIASFSGIGKSSSKSLMAMAAPLLMSVIGEQVKTERLGVSGMVNLLKDQGGFIQNLMPTGLASLSGMLGLNGLGANVANLGNHVGNTARHATNAATHTAAQAKGGFGKILPWLGLVLLALFAAYFLRNCGGAVGDMADKVVETTDSAVDGVKDAAGNVTDGVKDAANAVAETTGDIVEGAGDVLSGAALAAREKLGSLSFSVGSFGDKMSKFLSGDVDGNGRFTFDSVNFATGSSQITEDSKEQLNNLVTMLQAYPKVKIELEGHTDSVGNPDSNKKLSLERATMVRAYLMGQGIDVNRMSVKGLGAESPIADNGTKEGRAQNRRIDVVVTER